MERTAVVSTWRSPTFPENSISTSTLAFNHHFTTTPKGLLLLAEIVRMTFHFIVVSGLIDRIRRVEEMPLHIYTLHIFCDNSFMNRTKKSCQIRFKFFGGKKPTTLHSLCLFLPFWVSEGKAFCKYSLADGHFKHPQWSWLENAKKGSAQSLFK